MAMNWENAGRSGEWHGSGPMAAAGPGPARSPKAARNGHSPLDAAGKDCGRSRREHMTKLPDHGDALRMAAFLEGHPGWSAFWDKQEGVWRVAEDDPSSDLHAEDADVDRVIDYMVTHSRR